jgi:predicted phage terminase large subunit-like protein
VSIDSAFSTSETADYSAITLIYSDSRGHHVLFAERGRWDYDTLRDKALQYVRRYGSDIWFVVEAAGNGVSLAMFLKKSGFQCIPYIPKEDKTTRAMLALPTIHAGRVFIVNQEGKNSWVEPFINELVTFPQARFDDQVDSLVQVLRWAEPWVNPGGRFIPIKLG